MLNNIKISAIIPNFNHGNIIGKAICRLNEQKRRPDEIIIVDDASTDNSLAEIKHYSLLYDNIKILINKKNIGVEKALNRGLEAAIGDLVYCGAADDYVLPDLFFELAKFSTLSHNYGFITAEVVVKGESGSILGIRPAVRVSSRVKYLNSSDVNRHLKTSDNLFLSVSTLFSRQKLLDAGGFDKNLGPYADTFILRELALKYGYVVVPRVLGVWVKDKNSYSQRLIYNHRELHGYIDKCVRKARDSVHMGEEYANILKKRLIFFSMRQKILNGDASPYEVLSEKFDVKATKFFGLILSQMPKKSCNIILLIAHVAIKPPVAVWPIFRTKIARILFGFGSTH